MDWRAIEAATDAIVLRAFSESVRLSFMKNGVTDPHRPLQDIMAVIHNPAPEGTISLGAGVITRVSAGNAALVIERAAYPDLFIPNTPTEKTRVRANDRDGTPWWEVKSVSDRFSSILVAELNEL
ncbi:hypothetical protein ACK6D9_11650 [Hoeflea sp. Naph1]|uniref:hypothetical protein n=1 Tax=Hoeflea sp. Naph1 TaxID=3388653 RepID=UPI0039900A08